MTNRLQLVAVFGALVLFALVFELVRRRKMMERYALLWLLCAFVLAILAVWTGLLTDFSFSIGIKTPSNALFLVAFGFVLLLLLHFSMVISSLTDQTVVLAQRVGLLQQELDGLRGGQPVDVKLAEQVREFGPSPDEGRAAVGELPHGAAPSSPEGTGSSSPEGAEPAPPRAS